MSEDTPKHSLQASWISSDGQRGVFKLELEADTPPANARTFITALGYEWKETGSTATGHDVSIYGKTVDTETEYIVLLTVARQERPISCRTFWSLLDFLMEIGYTTQL